MEDNGRQRLPADGTALGERESQQRRPRRRRRGTGAVVPPFQEASTLRSEEAEGAERVESTEGVGTGSSVLPERRSESPKRLRGSERRPEKTAGQAESLSESGAFGRAGAVPLADGRPDSSDAPDGAPRRRDRRSGQSIDRKDTSASAPDAEPRGDGASGATQPVAAPRGERVLERSESRAERSGSQDEKSDGERRPVQPMPSALRPQQSRSARGTAARSTSGKTVGDTREPKGGGARNGSAEDRSRQGGAKGDRDRRNPWTVREFALQFAVVFLGVLVTFVGSGIIERWRQARAVRATMQLVAGELEYNLARMEAVCDKLRFDRRGMLLFERYGMDPDRIPEDSLVRYASLAGGVRPFSLQDDALETLKTSGLAASVEDERLLMELLGCYREMEDFRDNVVAYNRRKMIEAVDRLFAGADLSTVDGSPREAWRTMLAEPMFANFIASSSAFFGGGDETYFDRLLDRVDATARRIDERYGTDRDDDTVQGNS